MMCAYKCCVLYLSIYLSIYNCHLCHQYQCDCGFNLVLLFIMKISNLPVCASVIQLDAVIYAAARAFNWALW